MAEATTFNAAEGDVLIEVHDLCHFETHFNGYSGPFGCISVPKKHVVKPGPGDCADWDYVPTSALREYGWHVEKGLAYRAGFGNRLIGLTACLKRGDTLLVPPPTCAWPIDIPRVVEEGKVDISDWLDLYNENQDILAHRESWSVVRDERLSEHKLIFAPHDPDDNGAGSHKWVIHPCRQGIEALFSQLCVAKEYSFELTLPHRSKPGRLEVYGVPKHLIPQLYGKGHWLKKKMMAAILGLPEDSPAVAAMRMDLYQATAVTPTPPAKTTPIPDAPDTSVTPVCAAPLGVIKTPKNTRKITVPAGFWQPALKIPCRSHGEAFDLRHEFHENTHVAKGKPQLIVELKKGGNDSNIAKLLERFPQSRLELQASEMTWGDHQQHAAVLCSTTGGKLYAFKLDNGVFSGIYATFSITGSSIGQSACYRIIASRGIERVHVDKVSFRLEGERNIIVDCLPASSPPHTLDGAIAHARKRANGETGLPAYANYIHD